MTTEATAILKVAIEGIIPHQTGIRGRGGLPPEHQDSDQNPPPEHHPPPQGFGLNGSRLGLHRVK